MPIRHATEADVPRILDRLAPFRAERFAWVVAEATDPEREALALDRAMVHTTVVGGVVLVDTEGRALGGWPPAGLPSRRGR